MEGRALRCLKRRSTQSHVALFEYDHSMQYQCRCSGTISERVWQLPRSASKSFSSCGVFILALRIRTENQIACVWDCRDLAATVEFRFGCGLALYVQSTMTIPAGTETINVSFSQIVFETEVPRYGRPRIHSLQRTILESPDVFPAAFPVHIFRFHQWLLCLTALK